jgi:hypothetical protein
MTDGTLGTASGTLTRRLIAPPFMSTGDAVGAETTGLVASAAKAQAHNNSAPRRAETPVNVPALAKFARLFPGSTRNHTHFGDNVRRRTVIPAQGQGLSGKTLQYNKN